MAEGIVPEIALGTHLNPCSTLQIYILKLVVDLKQQRSANYTNYEMNFKAEKNWIETWTTYWKWTLIHACVIPGFWERCFD